MSSAEDVLDLLRRYAARERSVDIGFAPLCLFAGRDPARPESVGDLSARLQALAEAGQCRLEVEDGAIRRILFPFPVVESIRQAWHLLETHPESPFPTEGGLGQNIPLELLQVVEIKTGFVQALGRSGSGEPLIVRLMFPENLPSIVVTSDLLPRRLLEFAVQKVRLYLDAPQSASYILHKLRVIFPHRDLALKEMFGQLAGRPGLAVQSVVEASDFSFRFWAHLASMVIQEFRQKDHKLPVEIGYSQAAYLVGFYTVYFKGIIQKEKSTQTALRSLEVYLRKPPYAFTISDIFGFRDSRKVPLTQKYSQETLLQYLKEKTLPAGNQAVPEIVRLQTPENREYFLHRDVLLPLCLKKLYEASRRLREDIVEEWVQEMRQFRQCSPMCEDAAFLEGLEKRVKETDPVLHALLRYDLLFFTRQETKVRAEVAEEVARILDPKRRALQPLTVILGLRRRDLLARARMRLPVWMTIPVVRHLMALLKSLLEGSAAGGRGAKRAARRAGEAPRREAGVKVLAAEAGAGGAGGGAAAAAAVKTGTQSAVYRRALAALREHFVGPEADIYDLLHDLAERWNPLFDEQAQRRLVEDVNAMIRDYTRSLRRGFHVQPPDASRIRSLAQTLSENRAFRQIRRTEYLRRYIEVYMILLLGER